jgi:peptide/nickel transport system substrate-binding protein
MTDPRRPTPATPARLSRRLLGALAVAGLATVAACGGDDGGSASTGSGGDGDGATLRYAAVGAPATAIHDPHGGIGNQSDLIRFGLLYDVLAVPTEDGGTELRLATSIEPDDDDLTTWTVELRDDATFADGTPVDAEDVLFSLRRIDEKAAENFGRMGMFDLDAAEVVDDTTLTLVTEEPYAEVPRALESVTFVVPDGTTDFDEPVDGSGPFRFAEGTAENAVLERNPDWWGPEPPAGRIEVRAVPDPQARAQAVLAGQADVAASVNPATAEEAAGNDEVEVVRRPAATTYPFVMRLDAEPFDDERVRQAIKLAVDREELVETVFLGYGEVGDDLLTPTDPSSPEVDPPARDLDAARELLDEAGVEDLALTLHTTTSYPGMDTAATLVADHLGEIGIDVAVEVEPPDTYWTEVFAQADFYTGFFGGIPFVDVARVSLRADSPTNETAWQDDGWESGLDEALATADDDERAEAFADLQAQLRDEGGYVVWGVGDGLDLVRAGVEDLPTGPGFHSTFIDRVHVAD